MDSPGVTEDDAANSVIREITEQFQREMACGFIYILDATRAAEEAAQVCTQQEFSIRKTWINKYARFIRVYIHAYGDKQTLILYSIRRKEINNRERD